MGWTVSSCPPLIRHLLTLLRTRKPRALLDKTGRVFTVLAGKPKDIAGWDRVNAQVQEVFDGARASYKLDAKQAFHRRGEYPTISAGISYGGGQKVCISHRSGIGPF